jgi:hypothetical protein
VGDLEAGKTGREMNSKTPLHKINDAHHYREGDWDEWRSRDERWKFEISCEREFQASCPYCDPNDAGGFYAVDANGREILRRFPKRVT